jgi:DDE superfamily endonuclease
LDAHAKVTRRLEIHYTPKHASWLNTVEIEIGVMGSQCLDRRIPSKEILAKEVKAWQRRRNRDKSRFNWLFTRRPSPRKLGRAYPKPGQQKPESCCRLNTVTFSVSRCWARAADSRRKETGRRAAEWPATRQK